MSKEEEKLTPEEVMQSLQDHEEGCEKRQEVTNERFDNLEGRFDKLEEKFDRLEGRFDRLEDKVDRHGNWFLMLAGMILVAVSANIGAMAYFDDDTPQYTSPSHTKVIILDSQGRIIDSAE